MLFVYAIKAGRSGRFRVKLAHPNCAGMAFGKPCTSYRKPYLVAESGDYQTRDAAEAAAPRLIQGWAKALNFNSRRVEEDS